MYSKKDPARITDCLFFCIRFAFVSLAIMQEIWYKGDFNESRKLYQGNNRISYIKFLYFLYFIKAFHLHNKDEPLRFSLLNIGLFI